MFQLRAVVTVAIAAGLASALGASPPPQESGQPGVFDFYVLSLSWSPQFCSGPAGARDTVQCGGGRRFGFVVHGLWPQFERGWPENCAQPTRVSPAIVQRLLPIMPSENLIQHEWAKHGTCSGLGQAKYFDTVQNVYAAIRFPTDYRQPLRSVMVNPVEVKRKFAAANPGWDESGVRVQCGGRYLSEVRVCLTRDLKPRPCPASMRDTCRAGEVILRPVR